MQMTQETLLKEMKIRLTIEADDNTKDDLLLSYLSEMQEKIKSYCKRKSIPDALFYTVVSTTIEMYKYRSSDEKHIMSEAQGSRNMTYAGKNEIDVIISEYSAVLNRYRRIKVI